MKQLYDQTWAQPDLGVRIFLITGTKQALVVDTGMSSLDIKSIISEHTDLPVKLLNTHADPDHIGGNSQFSEFYMHPSEAFLYHNMHSREGTILPVYEGDRIDLGERQLEIIHLPGHTPGSITLLDIKNRCLLGGDPIQVDGDIYMFGLHRDMEAYINSLERLTERDDFDWIYPSHAAEKVDRSVIPQLIQGARDVMAGKVEGVNREVHGKAIISYDIGVARFLYDR